MEYPVSLNALLESTDLKYRWINIGRGIRSINSELFDAIETCHTPYPWPLAYQAWFALIVWNPSKEQEHTIWFFKLPLDEQGLIIPQARDMLIKELLVMLGIVSTKQASQSSLYTFDPDDDQKAAIHAKVSKMLAEPPSAWYQAVHNYLSDEKSGITWPSLGLQGFADIVERSSEKQINSLLANAISWVDAPVFEAVCNFLKNKKISNHLASAITTRIQQALTNASEEGEALPDSFFCSGITANAQAEITGPFIKCIHAVLTSQAGTHSTVLQNIGLYCWATLKQGELMKVYLDKLASLPDGQAVFNQQIADLMFIPDMRPLVLAQFRNPERSEKLGIAIGGFMSQIRG